MIQTIPQAKRIRYIEGSHVMLDVLASITLQMEVADERLVKAVRKHFPDKSIVTKEVQGVKGCLLHLGEIEELQRSIEAFSGTYCPKEGYYIKIARGSVTLISTDAAGLFYGIQTLGQIIRAGHEIPAAEIIDWPDTPLRCMNLDFRQTFSKPEKILEHIETFAAFKTNAILIEYEDKFPFDRYKQFIHPKHAFSDKQLEQLRKTAWDHFIEIIPLQQSFGHLEYVLQHDGYKELKETPVSIGELCPSKSESYELSTGLLSEMIAKHPESHYLHLGCDEVYSLCECDACQEAFGGSRTEAFIAYVNRLIDFTASQGKIPIIWHDMIEKCTEEDLQKLDKRAVVMIWMYNGKNIESDVIALTKQLRGLGIEVMGAPSVRCFDRLDDQNYPVIENRLENVLQWSKAADKLGLSGLVGTNWAAVFSLGVPYGIFETTWYPMALFADTSWNQQSDTERFIDRFLDLFHGLESETVRSRVGNYTNEDYYRILPRLMEDVKKNKEIAELISVMVEYETALNKSRTIHKYIYRLEMFPGHASEWQSVLNNYRITLSVLHRIKPNMERLLKLFQPADMAEHYIKSRFYLHEYLDEHLYREAGLTNE